MAEAFLDAAIKANLEIYSKVNEGFNKNWCEEFEVGAGGDVSCGLDLIAEKIFIKYLSPFGQIESEEAGIIGEGKRKIVIDPIDGSSNAVTNFPYFGSSIAYLDEEGIMDISIVCNYANGDIFYKIKNQSLKFGNLKNLNFINETRVTNPKVGLFERSYAHPKIVKELNKKGLKYRAPGAVALSLAYAHRVKYVLYVGALRIYDVAAGLALCEDLNVTISDNYVIVTQEKEVLDTIEKIVKEVENELR